MYRRTFTRLSLLSGGALIWPACRSDPSGAVGTTGLMSTDERKTVERFADVYLTTDGTKLKPLSEVSYVDNIDRRLSLFDAQTLEEVRFALKLFNYGSIPIGLNFRAFVHLDATARVDYIARLDDGIAIQRGLSALMKNLVINGYWQDIDAGRAVGYQGPISEEAKIPSLGNAPLSYAPPPRAG